MRAALLCLGLALAGCAPANAPSWFAPKVNSADAVVNLPAMQRFAPAAPPQVAVSNRDLTRDFIDLSMFLESGRPVERFTRFEGPVGVRVLGAAPPTLVPDLDDLLGRLRAEAGIDIARDRPGPSQITINVIARRSLQRIMPEAACFVIPGVSSLSEFRKAARRGLVDWAHLTGRSTMAVFLPGDVSPQEIRDCLHEEIAQALGPLNDLYRLPYSVFNDDNVNTVLTGYDMLILRMTYDKALRNGMTRAEVESRLPAIASRLNPVGRTVATRFAKRTPREWIEAVNQALGPGASERQRRLAADRALQIAQAAGWNDHRTGFSYYNVARLAANSDPLFSFRNYLEADRMYAARPETQIHRAFSATQLAAAALSVGDAERAKALLAPAIKQARAFQNATLLTSLLLLQSEALRITGQPEEARRVRLDSLGWARYGFDTVGDVMDKAREAARLHPAETN